MNLAIFLKCLKLKTFFGNGLINLFENSSHSIKVKCMLDKPNHSKDFPFPYIKIGRKKQSFSADWFKQYPWLQYDQDKEAAFCLHIL